MILESPLGFLALLLIPVIILIYIIKNSYTEQTVASTYLWELSERFIKRRTPINRLVGIISLILQILLVAVLSLAIVHPTIILKGAAHDYCFILDASGSMSAVENGKTRFEIAKDKIGKVIKRSASGSSYTLIYAGLTTEAVYEALNDKDAALIMLSDCKPDYASAPLTDALNLAQKYFRQNPSLKTYLYTDEKYETHKNYDVIVIGDSVRNCALSGVEYSFTSDGLVVRGFVTSYNLSKTVNVGLYFGDEKRPRETTSVEVGADEQEAFELKVGEQSFEKLRVAISEDDDMPIDNEVWVYNYTKEKAGDTLIVSDRPSIYLKAALLSAGMTNVDTVSLEEYGSKRGYGLYIFDSALPLSLPNDGAVWFINPQGSVPGANFSYQGTASDRILIADYSESTSSVITKLLGGVTKREFDLKQYVKCGLMGRFSTLISCEGNPIVFAGANEYGNREVVFAFDLKDATAFTLSDSYTMLVYNLLNYSFPGIIDQTSYFSGDTVRINTISGAESVKLFTPSGKEIYLDASADVSEYQINEVGIYSVVLVMKNRGELIAHYYSAVPIEERGYSGEKHEYDFEGEAVSNGYDGFYDLLFVLVIVLIVVAIADFGVYCYEQYQLR